eukprot:1161666-Pelagomonas_calceolata.AAC.3
MQGQVLAGELAHSSGMRQGCSLRIDLLVWIMEAKIRVGAFLRHEERLPSLYRPDDLDHESKAALHREPYFGVPSRLGAPAAEGHNTRVNTTPPFMLAGETKEGHRLGVRERREALATRKDAPLMHIEARHAQVEAQVRGMVEDALLARGVDAYNAYKYDDGA